MHQSIFLFNAIIFISFYYLAYVGGCSNNDFTHGVGGLKISKKKYDLTLEKVQDWGPKIPQKALDHI